MIVEKIPQIGQLNLDEKLQLIDEIWGQIADSREPVIVSETVVNELDRRMEEYESDPTNVTTWEAAKERILKSRQ